MNLLGKLFLGKVTNRILLLALLLSMFVIHAADTISLTVDRETKSYFTGMSPVFDVRITDEDGNAVSMERRYLSATFGSVKQYPIPLQQINNTTWRYQAAVEQAGNYTFQASLMRDNTELIDNIESTILNFNSQIASITSKISNYTEKLDSTRNFFKKIKYKAIIAALKLELSVAKTLVNVLKNTAIELKKPLASSSQTITVLQAPTPQIFSPENNAWHNEAIAISVATGWAGDGQIVLYLDNNVVDTKTFAAGTNAVSFTVDKVNLTEGAHTVKAAVMPAGFTESYDTNSVSVNVDFTQSVISNASPADSSFSNAAAQSISFNVADEGSGIDNTSLTVTLDAAAVVATLTEGSVTFTPETLAEGQHVVNVSISDIAGNIATAEWTFTVDTVKPSLSITTPVADSFSNQTSHNIEAAVSDATAGINANSVALLVDGQAVTPVYADNKVTAALQNLSDGEHTISLSVSDQAQNSSSIQWKFNIDTVKPVISEISVSNGAELTEIPQSVSAKISDAASGIESATITLDGTDTAAVINGDTISFSPNADLAAGEHHLVFSVKDKAQNITTQDISFVYNSLVETTVVVKRIDTVVSGIEVSAYNSEGVLLATTTTDETGSAQFQLAGSSLVTYKATDNGSVFASAEVTVPAQAEIILPAVSTFSVTYNNTPISLLGITAKDEAGNTLATCQTDENGVATFSLTGKAVFICMTEGYSFETELLDTPVAESIELTGSYSTVCIYKSNQLYAGVSVSAFDAEGNLISTQNGLSFGKSNFLIEDGKQFRFVVSENGAEFATALLTAPAEAELDIPEATTITVANAKGTPLAGVTVSMVSNTDYTRITDATGVANFSIAEGQLVQFQAVVDGSTLLSNQKPTPDAFILLAGGGSNDDVDTLSPVVSAMSPLPNKQVEAKRVNISASYTDIGSGVAIGSVEVLLDGNDITAASTVTGASFTYTPAEDMNIGTHTVLLTLNDNAGNVTQKEWTFELFYPIEFGDADGVVLDYPYDLGGKGTIIDMFGQNFRPGMVVTVGEKKIDVIYKDSTKVYLKIPELENTEGSLYNSQKVFVSSGRNAEPVELPVEIETLDSMKVSVAGSVLKEDDVVDLNENPQVTFAVEGGKSPYEGSAVIYHGDTSESVSFENGTSFSGELSFAEGINKLVFTAKDSYGNIALKEYWVNKDTTAPAKPDVKYMHVDNEEGDSVRIYWKKSFDDDKYILQVEGQEEKELTVSDDPVQTYIINDLDPESSKSVSLYAEDSAGNRSTIQTTSVLSRPFFDMFNYKKKSDEFKMSYGKEPEGASLSTVRNHMRSDGWSYHLSYARSTDFQVFGYNYILYSISHLKDSYVSQENPEKSLFIQDEEGQYHGHFKDTRWKKVEFAVPAEGVTNYTTKEAYDEIGVDLSKATLWGAGNVSSIYSREGQLWRKDTYCYGGSYQELCDNYVEDYEDDGYGLDYNRPYFGSENQLTCMVDHYGDETYYSYELWGTNSKISFTLEFVYDSNWSTIFWTDYGSCSPGGQATQNYQYGNSSVPDSPEITYFDDCEYGWGEEYNFSNYGTVTTQHYIKHIWRELSLTGKVHHYTPEKIIISTGQIADIKMKVVLSRVGWGAGDSTWQSWENYTDSNNNGKYDENEPFDDTGKKNGVYDYGEDFTDVGNGVYDSGENYYDSNENGQYDEGESFDDVGNGVWDEGEDFVDQDAIFCYIPTPIQCDQEGAHISNFDGPKFMASKPGIYTVKGKYGGEVIVEVVDQPVDLILTDTEGNEIQEMDEETLGTILTVNKIPVLPEVLNDEYNSENTEEPVYVSFYVKFSSDISGDESVAVSIPEGMNLYKNSTDLSDLIYGSYVTGYDDDGNEIVESVNKIAEQDFTVDTLKNMIFYVEAISSVKGYVSATLNEHSDAVAISTFDFYPEVISAVKKGSVLPVVLYKFYKKFKKIIPEYFVLHDNKKGSWLLIDVTELNEIIVPKDSRRTYRFDINLDNKENLNDTEGSYIAYSSHNNYDEFMRAIADNSNIDVKNIKKGHKYFFVYFKPKAEIKRYELKFYAKVRGSSDNIPVDKILYKNISVNLMDIGIDFIENKSVNATQWHVSEIDKNNPGKENWYFAGPYYTQDKFKKFIYNSVNALDFSTMDDFKKYYRSKIILTVDHEYYKQVHKEEIKFNAKNEKAFSGRLNHVIDKGKTKFYPIPSNTPYTVHLTYFVESCRNETSEWKREATITKSIQFYARKRDVYYRDDTQTAAIIRSDGTLGFDKELQMHPKSLEDRSYWDMAIEVKNNYNNKQSSMDVSKYVAFCKKNDNDKAINSDKPVIDIPWSSKKDFSFAYNALTNSGTLSSWGHGFTNSTIQLGPTEGGIIAKCSSFTDSTESDYYKLPENFFTGITAHFKHCFTANIKDGYSIISSFAEAAGKNCYGVQTNTVIGYFGPFSCAIDTNIVISLDPPRDDDEISAYSKLRAFNLIFGGQDMSKKITKEKDKYIYKITDDELAKCSAEFKEVYNSHFEVPQVDSVISKVEDYKVGFKFEFGGTQRSITFPK